MKKILLLLLFCPLFLGAQTNKTITLNCKKFVNCALFDSLSLYEQDGLGAHLVARAGRTEDSSFVFTLPAGKARFYAVGVSEFALSKVILGHEPVVNMYGDCAKITFSRATGAANDGYRKMSKRIEAIRNTDTELKNALAAAREDHNEKGANEVLARIKIHSKSKTQYLDSLRSASDLLGRTASLLVVPDYETAKKDKYGSEFDFYAKEYFQNANLNDPEYNDNPDLMEAFKNFATAVSLMPIMPENQKSLAEQQLAKFKPDSKAYKFALAGTINGFHVTSNPNYALFAERYIKEFKGRDRGEVKRLDQDLARTRTFTPGVEPPDLVGQTPDGGQQSLYAMRGKVVLIDFWASWCGPCIREMPAVKAAYEKYKDKGFDILGVSLDSQKPNWVNKINELGMPWKHISDLKGWQSEHAALYTVSSIPQTILLDSNGRIIQRNLRGEALESKLKEIFGE